MLASILVVRHLRFPPKVTLPNENRSHFFPFLNSPMDYVLPTWRPPNVFSVQTESARAERQKEKGNSSDQSAARYVFVSHICYNHFFYLPRRYRTKYPGEKNH